MTINELYKTLAISALMSFLLLIVKRSGNKYALTLWSGSIILLALNEVNKVYGTS